MLYVPTDAEIDIMTFTPLTDINGDIQNAAAQRQALKNFIAQDDYLNDLRGQYTEKYGGETPWNTPAGFAHFTGSCYEYKNKTNTPV